MTLTKPRYGFHPATFSGSVMDAAAYAISEWFYPDGQQRNPPLAVDPFAGTGVKLAEHALFSLAHWHGIELEAEFIEAMWVQQGDATALPYPDGYFGLAFTSPTYANRLADKQAATDKCRRCGGDGWVPGHGICTGCDGAGSTEYQRYSYTFSKRKALGVPLSDASVQLHPNNTGGERWGPRYRTLHELAWAELVRVLAPGALMLLNVKDFLRTKAVKTLKEEDYVRTLETCATADGKVKARQQVEIVRWHANTLHRLGIDWLEDIEVQTPGMRNGANREARATEHLLIGRKRP